MYSYVRQRIYGRTERSLSVPESNCGGEKYTSHKCMWKVDVSHDWANRLL